MCIKTSLLLRQVEAACLLDTQTEKIPPLKELIAVLNCLSPLSQRALSRQLWCLRRRWYTRFHFSPAACDVPLLIPCQHLKFHFQNYLLWHSFFCRLKRHLLQRSSSGIENHSLHHQAAIYALLPSTVWEKNPPLGQFAYEFNDKCIQKDLILSFKYTKPWLPALEMHYKTWSLCSLCLWLTSAREK